MKKYEAINDHIGLCPDCGKKRFVSKRSAKNTAKKLFPGDHLSPYKCGNYWHFGHLSYMVRSRGAAQRGGNR